jgi:hypothetical protein
MAEDIVETRAALLSELRRATNDPDLALDEGGDVRVRFGSAVACRRKRVGGISGVRVR